MFRMAVSSVVRRRNRTLFAQACQLGVTLPDSAPIYIGMWRPQRASAAILTVVIGASICLTPLAVQAQTTGSVRGFVRSWREPQRALVGAEVQVSNSAMVRRVRTNAQGFFVVWGLPPGRYALGAQMDQYNPSWSSVCVHAGDDGFANLLLRSELGDLITEGFLHDQYLMQFRPDPSQTVDLYSLGSC